MEDCLAFEPSEIAKFALILWFAHFISLNFKKMHTFRVGIFPHLIVVGITVGLVVVEPHLCPLTDYPAASLSAVMLFVGGVKYRWFIAVW